MERAGGVATLPAAPVRTHSLKGPQNTHGFASQALTYLDALYNLAVWMSRDPFEAEDLVQETYLKAIRFGHQFQEGTNLKGWLFTIMRNTYRNRLRQKRRESAWIAGDAPEGSPVAEGRGGYMSPFLQGDRELGALRGLVRSDIDRALARLPEAFRTPLILSDLEGCSQGEIAAVLKCPVGTVKSRIFRGRRLLKDLLKEYSPSLQAENG